MHVPRFGAALALLLLAGLVPAPAPAADPGRLHDSRRGEGQIVRGHETEKLDEATVELRESGYAEIAVHSFRGIYRFVGTWRPSSGKQVALDITEAYGERAPTPPAGSRSMAPPSSGSRSTAATASAASSRSASTPPAPAARRSRTGPGSNSTRDGAGDWQYGRSRDTLDRVTVELRRDGTGEIRFRVAGGRFA